MIPKIVWDDAMIRSWPLSKTLDTFESCDVLAAEFLTFEELKHEYRRYLVGDNPVPHYPVPAVMRINPLIEYHICRDLYRWMWSWDR